MDKNKQPLSIKTFGKTKVVLYAVSEDYFRRIDRVKSLASDSHYKVKTDTTNESKLSSNS